MIPSWETLFSLQGWCTRYEDVGNDTSNFTTTITTPTLLSYSTLSLSSLSILTAIAPSEPGLARTRTSPFWILLELQMMEVVVTTGAIRRAKLQSNCHHQQTNTQLFTGRMPFLLLNQQCQSTKGKGLLVVNKVHKLWNCWICIAACLPSTPATWLWDLSTWWWFVVSIWGRW